MDSHQRAIDLIKKYYESEETSDYSGLITEVCNYFDVIKNEQLSQGEIKFLISFANIIGVPQYIDMLQQKYQNNNIYIEQVDMSTFGAMLCENSLTLENGMKLHRYQKEVLSVFLRSKINRYVLSAPTSFGKTFLAFEIIKKMQYGNVVLIFPTISLLSENYEKLISEEYADDFKDYLIHSLSDDEKTGEKNIWIYTPERFLSFIDKNRSSRFDFIFIDEIYKIDNEYIIDKETIGENERDIAYRIALEYSCRKARDILLAGPYMEISTRYSNSFTNFIKDKNFSILNYNKYEIVNKEMIDIKSKAQYIIDDKKIQCGNLSIYEKIYNIVKAITSSDENTIIYNNFKTGTERYAKELITLTDLEGFSFDARDNEVFDVFIKHLVSQYGSDWIVVKALKKRIGIHHGMVPKYIQKEIINLFNMGVLCVLISTTTITEGVNTSAKNIIITSGKKGHKPLKCFDAQNIAGRAGRFLHHYKGRIIVVNQEFNLALKSEKELLLHKNFDVATKKDEVDYPITAEKYLSPDNKTNINRINEEISKRGIPDEIIEQFKVISSSDKLIIYDKIRLLSSIDNKKILTLIQKINYNMKLDWDGFQVVIDTISTIVKDQKLKNMIELKCANSDKSIITAKLHFYLSGGFFELLNFNLKEKRQDKDTAIRETAELIYNVFKYQLVKYLGVFDIMYRYVRSVNEDKPFEDVSGISRLLKKLEYNALNENARLLSDYGVPFKIVDFYEKENPRISFDEYEQYIYRKTQHLIR